MCSSWLPSAPKTQDSPFELTSFVRSLTTNRPRLPCPITFKDEQRKSLSNIVSRLSFKIENDSKSLNEKGINFLRKSAENLSENSRTELAADQISSSALRRRERVNLMIAQALGSTKKLEFTETLKSLASRIEESSTGSLSASTGSGDRRTVNSTKELVETDSNIFSRKNLLGSSSSSMSLANRGLEDIPRLLENIAEERKNILTKFDIHDTSREIKSRIEQRDKKSNSPISLTKNNFSDNFDKFRKKSGTKFPKRKSAHRLRGRRPKKLPSLYLFGSNKNKFESTQESAKISESFVKKEEEIIKMENEKSKTNSLCSIEMIEDKHQEGMITPKLQKSSKLEILKSRFASGSFLQQNATAKPSITVIPQNSRARAIFRPLAGIQEPEEQKNFRRIPEKIPNDQKFLKNCKTHQKIPQNPVWRPGGSPSRVSPSKTSPSLSKTLQKRSSSVSKEETKKRTQLLRSKTYIAASEDQKTDETKRKSVNSLQQNKKIPEAKQTSRNSKSLQMLKEILSIKDETRPSRIPTKSSQTSLISRSLLEKLTNMSDTLIPAVPLKENSKNRDSESQTVQTIKNSQSLQTVPEVQEQFSVFTETDSIPTLTDAEVSCNLEPWSYLNIYRESADAKVSCEMNDLQSEKISKNSVKIFNTIKTQTSRSLLLSCKEKRDVSLETFNVKFPCKEINTDKKILIDSSTGKDTHDVQNFCCDSQLINTKLSFTYSPINRDLRDNGVINQADPIESIVNINSNNLPECGSIVSSISHEFISAEKCLIDSGKEISSEMHQKHEESIKIPDEVFKAFRIATERAHNLYRAINIYYENIVDDEKMNGAIENVISLERIEEKAKEFDVRNHFKKLLMQQEVQIIIEEVLNGVGEKILSRNEELRNNFVSNESSQLLMKRNSVLPIIYGALCSLVFWSLQFSMTCDSS